MFGLEARGVDEDELGIVVGEDAGDAVAGGLGLAGDDGNLLPTRRLSRVDLPTLGRPTMAT